MKNNNNISKELSDIARDFQASQMRTNEIYNAIGRAYYTKTKGNPEGEFVQMFADLETVFKQQEQMEIRRKFLNGIVVCTNCKADNDVALSFCGNCGSRLPHKMAAANDGQIRCSNCGNILQPGQAFCGNCGTKAEAAPAVEAPIQAEPISAEAAATVETTPKVQHEAATEVQKEQAVEENLSNKVYASPDEQPQETTANQPAPEFKVFCGNCGTMVTNPEAMFCPNCGNRIVK